MIKSLESTLASLPDNLVRFTFLSLPKMTLSNYRVVCSFELPANDAFVCFRPLQLSEAELDVLGPEASFQEKMEVLQQQQDLIEEEAVQEKVRPFSLPLSRPRPSRRASKLTIDFRFLVYLSQEEESARKEAKELEERIKAEEKVRKDEERAVMDREENEAKALLPEAEVSFRFVLLVSEIRKDAD